MQGAEGAGVVELGEVYLVGEVGGAPVALLGGVPAVARVATKRNKQQSFLDDDWVDGQAVCEYLCICDKTLQRLRCAGKITYSAIGNKYYDQIAEIKRCLRAHTIKSSEEMLQNLIAYKRNSKAKASANVQ